MYHHERIVCLCVYRLMKIFLDVCIWEMKKGTDQQRETEREDFFVCVWREEKNLTKKKKMIGSTK